MSNGTLKGSLKVAGYSPEELYFYRLEQEAIAKLRKALGKEPPKEEIELEAQDKESENYQTYKKAA